MTINRAATATVLKSSVPSPKFGQPFTLTATVNSAGVSAARKGTVTFQDNGNVLGTENLNGNSQAVFVFSAAPGTGPHSYTAVYSGDDNFKVSTSPKAGVIVRKNVVKLTLGTSVPAPIAAGANFDLTATAAVIIPGVGTPTGNVTFKRGATILGTVALDVSGIATLAGISFAQPGTVSITATYAGDLNDSAVTSSAFKIIIV